MLRNEILKKIKIELDITGTNFDSKLNRYIDKAIVIIRNYLKKYDLDEDYILNNYDEAIIAIACKLYNVAITGGVKSQTLGKKSITYSDDYISASIIDDTIKSLLPTRLATIKMYS